MTQHGEKYRDPFIGLAPEDRIRVAARHLVGLTLLEGVDPNKLFTPENLSDSLHSILTIGSVDLPNEAALHYVQIVVADELAPLYERLNS